MTELRIIGGKARGRKIKSVPGETTRPITDKVREALFNIIGPDIQDATLLDLFAGTGSVGIEALSRGAKQVTFIDKSWQAISVIKGNLKIADLQESAEVVKSDAFVFFEQATNKKYDYVYIAPPQYKELWKRALIEIDTHLELLSEDAWIIVQIHPREYEPIGAALYVQHIIEFDQRHYGSTVLVFYRMLGTD